MREKGSKTSMEKLVKSSDFLDVINGMLKTTSSSITDDDSWIPNLAIPNKEVGLSVFLRSNFDAQKASNITKWWLYKGYGMPKWDLISTCTIAGERGILLVEAKAHQAELKKDKKKEHCNQSDDSKENHNRIAKAIADANTHMCQSKELKEITLSRDNCYQFSNRVAHAWWLANQGIPVVLLYLGFLNVDDLNTKNEKNKYKTFKTHQDWKDCFMKHSELVGANELIDKTINCGNSSFITICRSVEN